jgi:hypothetical protein
MKIYFLLGLFASVSFACEDINFYESKPSIDHVEIVDQADMNTCYAHTLAQMYNIDKSENKPIVHPYWVAFNHKQTYIHWTPRNLDYSLMSWAQRDLKKRDNCSYEHVGEVLTTLKNGVDYSDDQLMYALKYYFKQKRLRRIKIDRVFNNVIHKLTERLQNDSFGFAKPWRQEDLEAIIKPIRANSQGIGMIKFLKRHVFQNCAQNSEVVTDVLSSFGRKFESNDNLGARIERLLAEHKTVGVGYCAKPVYVNDPNAKDIKRMPRITKATSLKCGAHYSVLVGSRKKGESCQYLLRNSYGVTQWGHDSLECFCHDTMTNKLVNCKSNEIADNMRALGCWIDRDKLLNNTYDLSYLN